MNQEISFDKIRRRRDILFTNTVMVLIAYAISEGAALIAKLSGLSSITYPQLLGVAAYSFGITFCYLGAIIFKRNITITYANTIFFSQFLVWLIGYTVWIYFLHEIRVMGLFFAFMCMAFLLANSNFIQSLTISIAATVIQISVSYYAIIVQHQAGSFKRELFLALCFFPAAVIISYLANLFNKQKNEVKKAKNEVEIKSEELKNTMIELETSNRTLVETNKQLETAQRIADLDMSMAVNVQSSLFPKNPPQTPEWDIAFVFNPMAGVSGDLFDFFDNEGFLQGIGLFDVSGHGIASGLITMIARSAIFRNFNDHKDRDLGYIMEEINEALIKEIDNVDNYLTGIMLRFSENKVEYVNAGHPDLFVKKAKTGTVDSLEQYEFKGFFLGFEQLKFPYEVLTFEIEKGDAILLYSDCFNESMNETGEQYSEERIIESFNKASGTTSEAILKQMMDDFSRFIDGKELEDDFTVIIATRIV